MKGFICLFCMSAFILGNAKEPISFSKAKMFSLSSEEMVFASKLSDENRRRFCYTFTVKERSLSMRGDDLTLLPDQKVEQVFSTLYAQLESKVQAR